MVRASFCGFATNEQTHDEIANSVILSHWGLMSSEIPCRLEERLLNFGHCERRDTAEALAARGEAVPLQLPCFVPHKVRGRPIALK